MHRKWIGVFVVVLMMIMSVTVVAQLPTVSLWINGVEVEADAPPVIVNDRSMVPLRVITENMGGVVTWNAAARRAEVTTPAKIFAEKWRAEDMLMWDAETAAAEVAAGGTMVLDVRPAAMFDEDGIPGALNIPIPELADRMHELDQNMVYAVYCASDVNAAYGVAVLTMNQFNAYVLLGGPHAFMEAWETLDLDDFDHGNGVEEESPAIISVVVTIDEETGARTTSGVVSGNVEQVSIGSLRDLDNNTYTDSDRGHGAIMVDIMEDGTFSSTMTPGVARHPLLPGRHQTRVAILDHEQQVILFMDSDEFITE